MRVGARRTPSRLLAALVATAAAVALGGPAAGAGEPGPYEPIGEPIVGGSDAASAADIEAGDSLDTLGGPDEEGSQRWYRYERKQPGSTVHVSATISLLGADPSASDALELEAFAGSRDCGSSSVSGSRGQGAVLASYLAVPGSWTSTEECADASAYTFSVTRGAGGLDVEAPVEIRVIEEPEPVDSAKLARLDEVEPPAIDLSDPGEEVRGGRTFDEAVPLEPGSYRGRLSSGETQIFSLPVGWGQYASAAVEFPPPNTALAAELGDSSRPVALRIHAPTRALANAGYGSSYDTISGQTGRTLMAYTLPVAWANRQSSGSAAASSLAGDHYLLVTMAPAAAEESAPEVVFTLGVEVGGAVRGTPEYSDGEKLIGDPAGQEGAQGTLAVLGVVAVVLGAAALVAAAWLALRRRRLTSG